MDIALELKKIQGKSKVLKPVTVVEVAKDTKHPLHDQFEWDDSKAGPEHRLQQARQLIRSVTVQPFDNKAVEVRAFVSLPSDRITSGYRTIESVMGDDDLKAELLQDAKAQFEILKRKYSMLKELQSIWDEVDRLFK